MSAKNSTDFLTRLVVCNLRHYIVFFMTVWLLWVVVLTAFDGGSSATCCNLKSCKAHFEVSGLVKNAFPTGTTLAAKFLESLRTSQKYRTNGRFFQNNCCLHLEVVIADGSPMVH